MKPLIIGQIEISGIVDHDSEVEIEAECGSCEHDSSVWINKKQAVEIIDHLSKLFGLKECK